MRRHVTAVFVGVFVVVLSAAWVQAQQADPLEGTWKQNLAKSPCKASAGAVCAPAPQVATTRRYEGMGNGWVYVMNDSVNAQGMPTGNRFIARRDGRDIRLQREGSKGTR